MDEYTTEITDDYGVFKNDPKKYYYSSSRTPVEGVLVIYSEQFQDIDSAIEKSKSWEHQGICNLHYIDLSTESREWIYCLVVTTKGVGIGE